MRTAAAEAGVSLTAAEALELWKDVRRWPTFVEGFARVVELSPDWPAEGAKLVWESIPGGRGRVTEKVLESEPGRFRTRVFEEALAGEQTVMFEEDAEGTRIGLKLDYELAKGGPFAGLTDFLFIRRALRDAQRRTVRRFAVEAEEESGLR